MNKKKVFILVILIALVILIISLIFKEKTLISELNESKMIELVNKTKEEAIEYANKNNLIIEIIEEFSTEPINTVINQSISKDSLIEENQTLIITISKGIDYQTLKVDESGEVPIMMYHGIHNIEDNKYTGGNVDKSGYQRTASAFRKDLEFYYENGYRMIRLTDYVDGIIDVEAGKSPIILTFDDGLANNIKVTGLDEFGNIIIDPNSAVGILEDFKKTHPDMNVTATFFVNGELFNQPQYNQKIIEWLIKNGYDIGNHSWSHADFTDTTYEESVEEIGSIYKLLENYDYVPIVALPFGSPYKKTHDNFSAILNGTYEGKEYTTKSTLQVGWKASNSPFLKSFDKTFLTRIRAYDNNGEDWDIEYNFEVLENTRYISDGNKDIVSIPESKLDKITPDLNIKTY